MPLLLLLHIMKHGLGQSPTIQQTPERLTVVSKTICNQLEEAWPAQTHIIATGLWWKNCNVGPQLATPAATWPPSDRSNETRRNLGVQRTTEIFAVWLLKGSGTVEVSVQTSSGCPELELSIFTLQPLNNLLTETFCLMLPEIRD